MFRVTGLITLAMGLLCLGSWAEADDHIMGNYHGAFADPAWKDTPLRAEVVTTAAIRFRAVFYIGDQRVIVKGKKRRGDPEKEKKDWKKKVVDFEGEVDLGAQLGGVYTVTGQIQNEAFTGTLTGKRKQAAFELKRVFITPPSLGAASPEGAVVLLAADGENPDQWRLFPYWRRSGDGSFRRQGGDILSKPEFGDAEYHIEFQCPFMPNQTGQGRGNSGVYVQGRYEVQVLDSFGELPAWDYCGGIYKEAVPLTCASLPPLQWQTYDITFYAPKFDASGNKTKNAQITVVHNGVTIHDKVELQDRTPGGMGGDEAPTGPLLFQDHGNDVGWRNVWVKPLN